MLCEVGQISTSWVDGNRGQHNVAATTASDYAHLLVREDVQAGDVSLGVAVLAGLGGRDLDNLRDKRHEPTSDGYAVV